jgi:hypothetical protein
MLPDVGYGYKKSRLGKHTLRHDRVDVRMEMDKIAESLNGTDHGRHTAIAINFQLEHIADGLECRMAELTQQCPIVTEIHPQSLWNREYPLPMRNVGKHFIIQSMCKQQGSLLITRGTA